MSNNTIVQATGNPTNEIFLAIYKDNPNWIVNNDTQPDTLALMKQFEYPRTFEQQREHPYCIFNPDTRTVYYHCQTFIFPTPNPEYLWICQYIKQVYGADFFNKKPLIKTLCVQNASEIQEYRKKYFPSVTTTTPPPS